MREKIGVEAHMARKMVMIAAASLTLLAPQASATPRTPACNPNVGRAFARLQCLSTTVESLKAEIEEMRRSAPIAHGIAADAPNARISDLERRLAALEEREATASVARDRGRTDVGRANAVKEPLNSASTRRAATTPQPQSSQPRVLYEGVPLVKLPNPRKLNGMAGVQGMPDTQSGVAEPTDK